MTVLINYLTGWVTLTMAMDEDNPAPDARPLKGRKQNRGAIVWVSVDFGPDVPPYLTAASTKLSARTMAKGVMV